MTAAVQETQRPAGRHVLDVTGGGRLEPLPSVGNLPAVAEYTEWPVLAPEGWLGVAGEYAHAAAPYTEADPVGVLVSVLVGLGAVIGSGPYLSAGNDRHPPKLWAVLVGSTASRKGTAHSVADSALRQAFPDFWAPSTKGGRVMGGWASGEALIDELKERDGRLPDERLLVVEQEYARLLRVASRDGSTLSATMRGAWDCRPLEVRTRGAGASVAPRHHVAVLAHITAEELVATLTATDTVNGWANRFTWFAVKRARRLPEGGNVPQDLIEEYAERFRAAVLHGSRRREFRRSVAGSVRWADVYNALADDDPAGMLGAVLGRAEPQCARISLLLALMDQADAIEPRHIDGAYALWRYSRATAARLWGAQTGDPIADRLLAALRNAGAEGLTGRDQHEALGGHAPREAVDRARRSLIEAGLAVEETQPTGGRPRQVLRVSETGELTSKASNANKGARQ